jgi:hypothetical protein
MDTPDNELLACIRSVSLRHRANPRGVRRWRAKCVGTSQSPFPLGTRTGWVVHLLRRFFPALYHNGAAADLL